MNITSDGTVFGHGDPGIIHRTHELQDLFNTKMILVRTVNNRIELAINFHTKEHMPTVYLTAGTFKKPASIEAHTPSYVTVSTPYHSAEDVEDFRRHFGPLWQMTRTN